MKKILSVAVLLTAAAIAWSALHSRLAGQEHLALEVVTLTTVALAVIAYAASQLLRGGVGATLRPAGHGHGHGHGRVRAPRPPRPPRPADPAGNDSTNRYFLRSLM